MLPDAPGLLKWTGLLELPSFQFEQRITAAPSTPRPPYPATIPFPSPASLLPADQAAVEGLYLYTCINPAESRKIN